MDDDRKKSKKRSAASSEAQHKSFTFFIDQALGRKIVAGALREEGYLVEVLTDIFPQDTVDDIWIEYVGRNNRIAITKDRKIKFRTGEINSIITHNARIYRFSSGNLTGQQMAEIIKKATARILKHARNNTGPYIVGISMSGGLIPLQIQKTIRRK
jgi:predicted nuclease of predicted toxin-antitoxin system